MQSALRFFLRLAVRISTHQPKSGIDFKRIALEVYFSSTVWILRPTAFF
jgi:hypothetical protein